MKKKVVVIILVVIVLLLVLAAVIMFTDFGQNIRSDLYYKFGIPKETVTISEPENIKITYTYPMSDEKFDINITDQEIIKMVVESISNKKLNNETKAGIMLFIMGNYTIDLGNNMRFQFDDSRGGYVMIYDNEKQFITQIETEPLEKIQAIVDVELTKKTEMFQTKKVTVTNDENMKVNIERTSAIGYILNQCKSIYTKEMSGEITKSIPEYKINFNNVIKIFKYSQTDNGFLIKNGAKYEVYGISALDTILENAFNNIEEKEKMFNASKITITNSNKSIEITDRDIIDKITTALVYSDVQERDWLNDYNITEEYNNGTKIKINDYEFLIPGKVDDITIGNRYIVSKDKKIRLCFPLYDIEEYVNRALENHTK